MNLSDQQKKILNHMDSSILVSAGAGSGKTRTLTAKFVKLIRLGYSSKKILAITFTNKATNEMRDRIVNATEIKKKDLPWIKTYHSACFKILRDNSETLGLKNPIQIYSWHQQERLIKKILLQLKIDNKFAKTILKQMSNAKNSGFPEKYFKLKSVTSNVPLLKIYGLYQKKLLENNALDFDSILVLTRNLLKKNIRIRKAYKKFFQYILCDEYQDTNNLNQEIIDLLVRKNNFFAVGDDWQSIYSFRMSNVNHFTFFHEKNLKNKIFKLEENYRSSDKIVQLGNRLINFNKIQIKKKCYSKKSGGIIKIIKLRSDNEEAIWITKKIKSIKLLGISYKDMSILYRTKFCSLLFEQNLSRKNIQYNMLEGMSFFDKIEIIDLISYLSSAVYDKDNTYFRRIINIPKRGVGFRTIEKIQNLQTSEKSLKSSVLMIINQEILPKKTNDSLKNLMRLLRSIKNMKPYEAIRKIINDTNYTDHIKNYVKSNENEFILRMENIEQLISSAFRYVDIISFLEDIMLVGKTNKGRKNGVNLATMHKAKGLEFDLVFISGCEEQLIPHWRSVVSNENVDEERRLMYVSITRAKKYLFMTYTSFRKGQYIIKSRFLDELKKIYKNL